VTVVPAAGGGSEEIVYVHHDMKGSTVALTEPGGSGPAETYTYSDYGAPQSGSWLAYQYAGYRYDSETGLYYMPARSYSPTLGRFLQADPSGFGGGFNLYAYAGNDPVNLKDSTGLTPDGGGLTITLSESVAMPFAAFYGGPSSMTVSATATVCPIYCNAGFIKASIAAWMRAGDGLANREAGFWVTGTPGSPSFTPLSGTNESMTITNLVVPPNALALVHTHPNAGVAQPSAGDIKNSNKSGLPFYVLSSRGLWLHNPGSPTSTVVRPDTSWQKPCQ
jgi:RHS repeat-associated protein